MSQQSPTGQLSTVRKLIGRGQSSIDNLKLAAGWKSTRLTTVVGGALGFIGAEAGVIFGAAGIRPAVAQRNFRVAPQITGGQPDYPAELRAPL